jgi:acyl-CoA reductase-like NAD-dependent aldehyde dehydrogenase
LNPDKVVFGGDATQSLYIAPTLIDEFDTNSAIMQEIFGPVLPILTHTSKADIKLYQIMKPLALYVFTESNQFARNHPKVFFGGAASMIPLFIFLQ